MMRAVDSVRSQAVALIVMRNAVQKSFNLPTWRAKEAKLQHFQIQLATKGDAGVQALLAYAGKACTSAVMLTT